tara:strand:+ start:514 stop:1272 length:759 start_codon:yes stop_codon:yes gene_type:complete
MIRTRLIPTLLLKEGDLVKTLRFKKTIYLGDPINAVKIFNDKEVDELVFLDISQRRYKDGPNYKLLEDIVGEAFMPFSYGGGITNINQMRRLYKLGIEKVILNTAAIDNPKLVYEAAQMIGASGVVVSIDIKRGWRKKLQVKRFSGTQRTSLNPIEHAKLMEELGAGELILNSIHCDGMMTGYDLEMIQQISSNVSIPVIACGGAGKLIHFQDAINAGASAVGGGSFFVFHGPNKAVLLTYPNENELIELRQ